ncbi:MAG: amino acid adenylation domain-containing protein, partial [Bacteroidota bacterium]
MALEAGRRASGLALNVLSDVTWVAPLIVQDAPQQVFITLYPEENKLAFEIGSGENDAWLLHCKGYLLPGEKESTRKIDVPALLAACPNLLEKVPCDALFKELGFEYGSFFQHTERIQYGDRQSISTLRQSDNSNQAYLLHPGQLDAALRTAIGLALAKKETPTLVVPFSLRELSLLGDTRQIRYAYARPHPASEANAKVPRYDMDLLNDAGEVIVSIRDFAGREMNRSAEIPKGNKAKAATSTIANTSQAALVAQDFASKTDAQLRTETLEYLKGILTKELHISADKIQEDTPFYDYGVDSMTAVDIIHTLEEVFGPLPATLLFEQMDLAELADYFVAKHRSKLAGLSQPSFTQQKEEESADQPFIKSSSRQSEKNGRLLKRGGNSFFGSRINEDMAIVGMEGLFPGAPHAEALWNQVLSEQCPEYIDQNGNAGLHFGRVKEKDLAEYMDTLGLSKEALVSMSRQQRMILGVTAEAMAKYGISRKDLSARKTGVFIGAQQTFDEDESPSGVKYYDYAAYLIPNKISFLLNLQGPSEVINTHCTSVYVALHRAIQSIHAGECEQAIVGGVNVISEREFNYTSSIGYETLLSLDHKTRSFCEDANGFVRSEGAGVVIIKRLSQAERDSNKILAVIKGTAVYHGGRGFSMEAPSAKGIKEVIKTCLEKSGITPDTIDYVEAHGIANRLADAIELGAISEAYRGLSATPDKQWHLSSVKPAVGHAELAAGMASLIKTLKAFEHHIIPGIPGLDSINKDLAPGHSIVLQAQAQQWPQSNYPKRAALNSYAVGGVNAHIILEEYVAEADRNARNKTEATVVAKDNGLVDARKTFTISKEVDAVLAQIVEEVFELDIQQLDLALSPVEYGFDSVKVVQFTRRINERLEIDIKMGQVLGLDDFRSFFHLLQREWSSRHQALPSTQLAAVQDNIITQYPISEDQKALCFIQEAWPDSTAYNIPLAFGLPGKINPDWLQQAFALVLAEHPILRVNFIQDKETGHRVQTVRPLEKCVQIDTQAITEGQDVTSLLLSLLRQPFNLAEDSLIRLHVREHISANKTYLLFVVHHIVFDGTSSAWFIQSFWDKYQQLVSGKHQSAKPVDLAYFDYVEGEHTYLESPQAKKDLAWWKATLEGISPALPLPYDRLPTGEGFDASVGCETFTLKTTELAALKEVAKAFKTNLSVLLLAVFNVLIHKLTQEEDIAITAPTAGRPKQIHENSIGFYIHVIVTRSQVQAQQSFEALVKDVRQKFVDGIDHASYPFSSLMSALGLGQLHSRELNFPVAYMFQNIFEAILDNKSVLNGLEILDTIYQETDNKYTLEIYDLKETLQVNLKYNQGLFDRTTIQRHLGYFHQLVQAVIANPQGKIADYPILSSEEKYQLVTSFNDTLADYPQEVCLHELFEAQAKKTPHQVAIAFGEEQLSYQALEQQSTQLACYLQQQGVTPDTLVGICMERSIEVIVAILGVLKSGAAYVPIDPHYPKDRILYVLEDSQVPFVLTQGKLKEKIQRLASQTQCQLLSLEDDWETGGPLTSRLTSQVRATNLAYVIYTSGSTGKPKGVMVEHAAVVNYVLNFIEQFKVNASDKFIHGASISFDISIEEIFPILLSGGCLVISKDGYLDVDGFVRELHDHQVTIVSTVPAVIQQLNSRPLKNLPLRLIISGADVLKPQWISELQPSAAIYNTYGPTEATVCASYYKIEGVTQGVQRIPIGKPIRNTQIYLLDKALSVVPIGVAGELHIAGAGLARGYLNRPALTEEKFINNPWGTGRLYKTGDQARWLADGNIEYLGRIDEQIKVRGLRIEPGEIESILTTHAPIQQAVVIARDQQGDKQLIAYYVATEAVEAADLRSHLQKTLPDYMIPAAFLRLEEIPLLATGKVNRKWLQTREVDLASSKVYVAPRTAIESALATIWEAVLGIEKVGIYDNFFELGGDSLLVTRVVSAIRKNLSVELAIKDLFSRPSIALLSELISTEGQEALLPEIIAGERPAKIPLSFSQQRLWFIDKLEGSIHYHIPFALRFEGNLDKDSLNDAFREIVNRHEALRTVFKDQDGEAYQEVLEKNQWQLVYTAASNTDGKEQLEALLASEIRQPFDLSKDHMLRAHVVKLAEQTHVLLVVMHHIASDGWSVAVLAEELIALYTAKKENRLAQLPALPIQYSDYALWQRAYLTEAILKDKLRYWQEKLSRTTALNLPSDHLRPAILSNKGGRLHFAIAKPLRNQLTDLSKQEGVTMFMLLLSAFKVLLYRYSGQEDICVGSPIANRVQKEVEPLIGFFVNTLVLRSNLGQNPRFTEVLSQVKATTLEAYAHQDVPLEKIVDSVEQDRAMSRSPLFQVMFVLQNTPAIPKLSLDGITLETEPVVYNVSKLDLTFHVTETAEGLDLMVEYCSDLFLPATINRMMAHYQRLLSDVVAHPMKEIGKLRMLSVAEEQQLRLDFNPTSVAGPPNTTLVD